MKNKKCKDPVYTTGRVMLLSLFYAAAGVYAVADDGGAGSSETTGGSEPKNIWVGSYSSNVKGNITLSQDKDGLNITASSNLDFVKSDVKYDNGAIKGAIKVDPSSVDLKMKAVSEEGNATVFESGDINLSKEESFRVSEVGKIDASKAEISALEVANFKLEAEAIAEKGEARAVKVGAIDGARSRVSAYDDSEGKHDEILNVKSENRGDIEIKAVAKGKTLANAIEATEIYGGNVALEAVATATAGDANAILVDGISSKGGKSSIKASAEATNGKAVAIKASEIDVNSVEASAVSKAQLLDQQDKSKLATAGDATAIDSGTIYASTVKASALSEGGNAMAVKGSVYGEKDLTIEAVAEAKKAQISESADGKEKTFAAGNATAIEGYKIAAGGWKNDQSSSDEAINDVNVNIKASAVAEGLEDKIVEATAIKVDKAYNTGDMAGVVVGNEETKTIDVVKTLPEKLTKNVSATINASASAGTAVDGKIATKGNATAFNGDINVGSLLTVDNASIVPNEDAEKTTVKETLAPIQIDSLVAADRLGKVSLNGSFSAQAVGGDAIAIDAKSIEIGNRVTLEQYDYTTTEAESGNVESAFNDDGTLKQKYAKDENGDWKPKYIDANGNETFEETDKIATVELKADKDGKYAMTDAVKTFKPREVVGDFNADVSAASLGGSAKGIRVANRLGANINGNISAESKANVIFEKDAEGNDTKVIDKAKSSFGNASAIYGIDDVSGGFAEVKGNINGNLSAKSEGGMATGMFAGSFEGDINGNVSAENTALKSVKLHEKQEYVASVITSDVNGVVVYGDMNGDINGTVSAKSEGGNVIGVKANAINGAINGTVSAESKAVLVYKVNAEDKLVIDEANSKFGTAVAVDPNTENLVINGTLSAVADSYENTPSNAVGLDSTDGKVNFGNGAIVSAKQNVYNAETGEFEHVNMKWDDVSKKVIKTAFKGNAIETGGELNVKVDGRADIKGNVEAGGAMNVSGGNLVVTGDLTGVSAINLASDANLAMTADAAGNMAKINVPVNYAKLDEIETAVDAMTDLSADQKAAKKAEMKNSYLASVRANKFAGNATMLVNDKTDLGKLADLTADQAFQTFDKDNNASPMTKDDVNALGSLNGDSINFSYSVDNTTDQNVTMKVNKLSYFQNKAANANSARLGAALDGITTIEAPENETMEDALDRAAAIQARRDFKSDVETLGMAASGSNTSINLDGFMPTAQSFIAQLNNEALVNMNTVQMFRLASRADAKRDSKKHPIKRDRIEGVGANVAEFQSINMLGSQDGGANAAGFDFWSAGGVAAIERDFSENTFAGLSLGGTYNKVDGDANANANSTNFIANVYGEYSFDQIPLDIFMNLGYSHGWNETSRQTALGTATADYDSNSFYTLGGVAYTFSDVATKGLSVKPMLMYNLAYSNADSADEEGAGFYNASMEGNDYLNFRTMLGVEVKYDITSDFSALVRAFWTHEFADNSYDVDYRIAQAASYMPSAKFEGEEVGRDAAVLGLGLQYKFNDATSAFVDYSATLRSAYSAHGLNLGAQFRF